MKGSTIAIICVLLVITFLTIAIWMEDHNYNAFRRSHGAKNRPKLPKEDFDEV